MVCGWWLVYGGVCCVLYGVWCMMAGVWCVVAAVWCIVLSRAEYNVYTTIRLTIMHTTVALTPPLSISRNVHLAIIRIRTYILPPSTCGPLPPVSLPSHSSLLSSKTVLSSLSPPEYASGTCTARISGATLSPLYPSMLSPSSPVNTTSYRGYG